MPVDVENSSEYGIKIKVIGVGGGGSNVVNHMINSGVNGGIHGIDFFAVNPDKDALTHSKAPEKILIGENLTKGQGAGANPDIRTKAAEESTEEITAALNLKGADMVFITAGMGGGTGTGVAPIIAKIAKAQDILTVGIVTKPFEFEGQRRAEQAEKGIAELRKNVDTLIVIPSEKIKEVSTEQITMMNCFKILDDIIKQGILCTANLINVPGYINIDFADVCLAMKNKNAENAHVSMGHGKGEGKAETAAQMIISSPLLESSVKNAKSIIMGITASPDIRLEDIDTISSKIHAEMHQEAFIIWGVMFDSNMEHEIHVTMIAI